MRIINQRKHPLSPDVIRERAAKYRVTRQFVWIDPFPEVLGTRPEKMVYAEFVKRGIPFEFQQFFHAQLPDLDYDKFLRPDIVVPDAKIIIAVQGNYFHSLPKTVDTDAFQFAIYQMLGWTVLAWWETDIETRLQDLISAEPALLALQHTATQPPQDKKFKAIDDLRGIRTKNRNRAKPWTHDAAKSKNAPGLF